MIQQVVQTYIDSFKGFRKEVWWLALVVLINRAGTMVIPFLSLYLTTDLKFTLSQVGWIMSAFGLGAVVGSFIGGKLADKIGYYPVLFWSLVLSGIMFILMQYVQSFIWICVYIFGIMVVADTFRPAAYVAINVYSKPENRTRSVSLIRLAINLGFSMGPGIGGFIIAGMGYKGLFWADGITCLLASVFFLILLSPKESREKMEQDKREIQLSPYKDTKYLIFIFAVLLIGFAFMQLFSVVPLYFRDIHHLSEDTIGLLMTLNGMIIFTFEMPVIKYLENPKFKVYRLIIISTLVIASSYLVYNLFSWTGILVISMLLFAMGEMVCFPFLNRVSLDRSVGRKSGDYMALFTMSFSIGQIFSHKVGMEVVDRYGYAATWYVMTGFFVVAVIIIFFIRKWISGVVTENDG